MATIFKRGETWWMQYFVEGRRTRISLHTTDEKAAKQKLKQTNAQHDLRMLLPGSQKVKIKEALGAFLELKRATLKPSSVKRYQQLAASLSAFFEEAAIVIINDLTEKDVSKFILKRQADGAAGKTIGEELLILKGTIQHLLRGRFLTSSPIQAWPKIRKTTTKQETVDRYSGPEIARLKDYFKTHKDYDYFLALIYTGCRRSEVWEITRGDVDLEEGRIRLQNVKTGTNTSNQFRKIEIHPEFRPALESRCAGKGPGEKLFPKQGTGIWLIHALRKACTKLGIAYRRLHGLRHAFISALLNAGVPPRLVMAMVGHGHLSTTLKYSHVSEDDLRGRIGKLGY